MIVNLNYLNALISYFAITLSLGWALKEREFFTLHKWSEGLEMSFETVAERETAIKMGYLDVNRIQLPVDVDIEYRENGPHRTFLTIPRLNFGVPYSLATIAKGDEKTLHNPKVEPYPNYEWHKSQGINCSGITSALRTYIDDCQRLWIIDSGQINSLQWCRPQILAFDLQTNHLVHAYKFPSSLYKAGISVYTDLVVDIESKNKCIKAKLYISDAWGHGLIVYDLAKHKSWRIEHELMKPDANVKNNGNDGIFTVSLSPQTTKLKERFLYFHSLNSVNEIRISLSHVNNASLWYYPKENSKMMEKYFNILGSRGTQCESETMDSYGNLYCSLIGSNALVRWKEGSNYTADNLNVVAYDPKQWRFVTGLKTLTNHKFQQELWALSTEPSLFVSNPTNSRLLKYQIIGCRIKNLLKSEPCTVGIGNFE